MQEEIEKEFDGDLVWERLDDKRASRIKAEISANVFNSEDWPKMIEFMIKKMINLEKLLGQESVMFCQM